STDPSHRATAGPDALGFLARVLPSRVTDYPPNSVESRHPTRSSMHVWRGVLFEPLGPSRFLPTGERSQRGRLFLRNQIFRDKRLRRKNLGLGYSGTQTRSRPLRVIIT